MPWESDDATRRRSHTGRGDRGLSQTREWGAEEPTSADVWLLGVVYEFVAVETTCSRCGAPLSRRMRVDYWPTVLGVLVWRVVVRTRCGGRRRHAHMATVGRSSNGLVLSPLRSSRR